MMFLYLAILALLAAMNCLGWYAAIFWRGKYQRLRKVHFETQIMYVDSHVTGKRHRSDCPVMDEVLEADVIE